MRGVVFAFLAILGGPVITFILSLLWFLSGLHFRLLFGVEATATEKFQDVYQSVWILVSTAVITGIASVIVYSRMNNRKRFWDTVWTSIGAAEFTFGLIVFFWIAFMNQVNREDTVAWGLFIVGFLMLYALPTSFSVSYGVVRLLKMGWITKLTP